MSQTWPPVAVSQNLQLHANLIELVRSNTNFELDAPLGHHLIIRSTGLIETTRDTVARDYAQSVSHPRVHRRISNTFVKGQGCEPKQLTEFIKSFDEDWADKFDQFLQEDDQHRGNQLSMMVGQRKRIAHGLSTAAKGSQALQWSDTARDITKWLIDCFDPR